MEQKGISTKELKILRCVAHLPQKMLKFSNIENIVEFVLHTLCDEQCFNFSKAAYFVDNFDFDCLKGIAGFNKLEKFHSNGYTSWDNPKKFTEHMQNCLFNKTVRKIDLPSFKQSKQSQNILNTIAEKLSMKNPLLYSWEIKYNNTALLMFETVTDLDKYDEELLKSICLLGFCPIF